MNEYIYATDRCYKCIINSPSSNNSKSDSPNRPPICTTTIHTHILQPQPHDATFIHHPCIITARHTSNRFNVGINAANSARSSFFIDACAP